MREAGAVPGVLGVHRGGEEGDDGDGGGGGGGAGGGGEVEEGEFGDWHVWVVGWLGWLFVWVGVRFGLGLDLGSKGGGVVRWCCQVRIADIILGKLCKFQAAER